MHVFLYYIYTALLDDLDKELNNYIMRCREWYGWHFPELGKVVTDHLAFARLVKMMGIRTNISECDLSKILPEEVEEQVKCSYLKFENTFFRFPFLNLLNYSFLLLLTYCV